jgi:tetratricopeptide (TPR) repeat protein
LRFEEANLLFARSLAYQHGWWDAVISTMQGLLVLYDPTGRSSEWKRLVDEIVPYFVDAETSMPLPGREKDWVIVTQYRVNLAGEALQLAQAEDLQRIELEWNRGIVERLLALSSQELSGDQRNSIRSFAVSLEKLGSILREQDKPECADFYHEAIQLCQLIGDTSEEAVIFYNLGHAYLGISTLRNIDKAEHFYLRSLELREVGDFVGRSCSYNQLSIVECQRFDDAIKATHPDEAFITHLINSALVYCQKALDLLPPYAVSDLGITHHQMGIIYRNVGHQELALSHYYDALRYHKLAGDSLRGAATCYQIALTLKLFWLFDQSQAATAQSAQLEDALSYARIALMDCQQFGEATRMEQNEIEALIQEIKGLMGSVG